MPQELCLDLQRQKVRVFVPDDLPSLEEVIRKIFAEADWQLCVLHTVWDALNQARKKDREARAKEALGLSYPKIVACWEIKAYALLAFLRHPQPIRRYLCTTNGTL